MNTAQRMESSSKAGAIHVSESTRQLLNQEVWSPTGGVEVRTALAGGLDSNTTAYIGSWM